MKILKILLPLIILGTAVAAGKYLSETGPEAKKKPNVERLPVVEVMPLKLEKYSVVIETSGIVRAGRQSSLISEVSGRVVSTSEQFQEGAYIGRNETLLTIDKANYQIALSIVESEEAGNRAALAQLVAEEKSNKRSLQLAQTNLHLGKKEVRRIKLLFNKKLIARTILESEEQKVNQLQQQLQDLQGRLNTFSSRKLATQAKLSASLARKKQENLNLSRTTIKAPYAGRILEKNVDVGQFVTTGSLLGKVVATDYVDVSLPLSLNRYELLGIPENVKNKKLNKTQYPEVSFTRINSSTPVNQQLPWKGRIVRTSVALDSDSRQITVIARIENPFDVNHINQKPIRIGQYVKARIEGKQFNDVYILPPIAVRQDKEILLLKNGEIEVVSVNVIWRNPKQTVVKTSKNIMGRQLIITPLNQAVTGMKAVTIEEQREKNALQAAKKSDKSVKPEKLKSKAEATQK